MNGTAVEWARSGVNRLRCGERFVEYFKLCELLSKLASKKQGKFRKLF